MLKCSVLFSILIGLSPLPARSESSGWRQLFNGRDLTGWQHVGPGRFAVEHGLLRTEGGMGLLWYTREKIGNALLRVIFRFSRYEDDSGVFIRIPEKPTEPWMPINRGYEVEIGNWPDDYSCTGVLYSLTQALHRVTVGPGPWYTLDITIDGAHTLVFVEGTKVTDYTEGQPVPPKKHNYEPDRGPRPPSGYIGLQNHSKDSVVFFREVAVKPLKKQGILGRR